jgi:metallophosphoesterase (TIGR03767 family)
MTHEEDEAAAALSRRAMLGLGAAAAGAVAAGSLLGAAPADAVAVAHKNPKYPVAPHHSTLARTLLHGSPGAKGYRRVIVGPGEKSHVRRDLLGGRTRRHGAKRTPLVAFGQFTDMHIVDAQSPARVEFLDRFNDPGNPFASVAPFSSAYRAHEMLTAHVAESMVEAVNKLAGGPVTGRKIDFTVCTGDNSDNTQYNEVRWHIDILDGRQSVRPDSGSHAHWDGVGGPTDLDPSYWHPDGTPPGGSPDKPHATYGFPSIPGLLDRCRAPFRAHGLRTPWYSTFGNHDGLVQGNVPPDAALNAIATSGAKVTGLPAGVNIVTVLGELAADPSAVASLLASGPAKSVPADPKRRMLSHPEMVAEYFKTTGAPVGHGYTKRNLDNGTAYYTFHKNGVQFISLDTVNLNGYDDGSLDQDQYDWLIAQLQTHSSRHLGPKGKWVRGHGQDRLIVIFSHHTVDTMENVLGANRVNGTTVASTLLQYPNVIAWVNGHTHLNMIKPYARAAGAAVGGGFWEINTASHIDWPQQSRTIEIVDNGDRTLSLFGTMIDHAGHISHGPKPTTPLQLAALSRELGINDWQRAAETATVDGLRGRIRDRNVELLVRAPFRR